MKNTLATLLALTILGISQTASAATLNSNTSNTITLTADNSIPAIINSNTNVGVDADVDASINNKNESTGTNTSTSVGADINATATIENGDNQSSSSNTENKIENGGVIHVEKASVMAKGGGVKNYSAVEVQSSEDLQAYLEALVYMDPYVETASVENDKASFKYSHKGSLFGFIPVTLNDEIVIDANSENDLDVKVNRPWWSVFASSDTDVSTDVIASNVENSISNVTMVDGSLSVNGWARVIADAHTAVESTLQ